LIGKGYQLSIYDRDVSLAKLFGANKEYIEREIPHISQLMCDSIADVVNEADVIIIGNKAPEFKELKTLGRDGQTVIDLVRLFSNEEPPPGYEGICW
jgi:GDP-mannose 6-dehydrogenase